MRSADGLKSLILDEQCRIVPSPFDDRGSEHPAIDSISSGLDRVERQRSEHEHVSISDNLTETGHDALAVMGRLFRLDGFACGE